MQQNYRAPTGRKARTALLPRRGDAARRVILLPEEWPEPDRQAWMQALTATRRSARTSASGWAPSTRAAVARSYGLWLAWLAETAQLDPGMPPACRATLERVDAFAGFLHDSGQALSSIGFRLGKIAMALDAMDPAGKADRRWLRAFAAKHPGRLSEDVAAELRLGVSPSDLHRLGCQLMEEGDALAARPRTKTGQRGAVRYRDGLMLALQAHVLLRPASLLSLEEGVSVVLDAEGVFRIALPAGSTKGRRALDAPIPDQLQPAIERYLAVHRPALLKGHGTALEAACNSFWVTGRGRPMSAKVAWDAVRRTAASHFGVSLSVHRIRHVGASHIATEAPELLDRMRDVLHHKDAHSLREHYDLSSRHVADERFEAAVDKVRGERVAAFRQTLAALRKVGPRRSGRTRGHARGPRNAAS